MTNYVEARSLASLNYLASNPPQYPKKPAEEKQDPLTLYISRVPGTRGRSLNSTLSIYNTIPDNLCLDIILSTLKPQRKNVTAEDVASSLYYIHLSTSEVDPLDPPHHPSAYAASASSGEGSPASISQIQN